MTAMTIVGVSDMKVSNDPDAVLVTYSLGSCIGVSIYDPVAHVGGLLHFMLPDSKIAVEKARHNPCMFLDTGLPALFKKAYRYGAHKKRIIIKIAGGAQVMNDVGFFNIGRRNYIALQEIINRNGLCIAAEHIGGNLNRTMRLEIATGRVYFKVPGTKEREL